MASFSGEKIYRRKKEHKCSAQWNRAIIKLRSGKSGVIVTDRGGARERKSRVGGGWERSAQIERRKPEHTRYERGVEAARSSPVRAHVPFVIIFVLFLPVFFPLLRFTSEKRERENEPPVATHRKRRGPWVGGCVPSARAPPNARPSFLLGVSATLVCCSPRISQCLGHSEPLAHTRSPVVCPLWWLLNSSSLQLLHQHANRLPNFDGL